MDGKGFGVAFGGARADARAAARGARGAVGRSEGVEGRDRLVWTRPGAPHCASEGAVGGMRLRRYQCKGFPR